VNNKKSLSFESIKINQTEHLFGDTAKPFCNIIVNMTYPSASSNKTLKDTLTNSILTLCLGEGYAGQAPQIAVRQYTKNYITQYRKELEPLLKQNSNNSLQQWYTYYRSIIGKVRYNKPELLTYQLDYNEYSGGAHGIYSTTFENFDIKNMKKIKLNDLFRNNYQNELTSIIVNQLMKDKGITTTDALLNKGYGATGNINPTENFYLDDDGITFYYNVYEIAPYSMGPISVRIPYSNLKNIMIAAEFKILNLI
jgi:hypothetical protein